jgi:hypothetical protein
VFPARAWSRVWVWGEVVHARARGGPPLDPLDPSRPLSRPTGPRLGELVGDTARLAPVSDVRGARRPERLYGGGVGTARLLLIRMNRRVSLSALLLLVLSSAGCSSSSAPTTGAHPSTSVAPSVPALNLAQPDNPLPAPTTYSAVCDLLSSTCATLTGPPGALPAALVRPLKFPTVSPGTPCPTSAGAEVDTGGFGGIALGLGDPVRPLGPFTTHGIATGSTVSMDPPWFGPKTLWYVVHTRGPFSFAAAASMVRGRSDSESSRS